MSLDTIRMEHIRGAILGLLPEGVWTNDAVLHDGVNSVKYVSAGRDQVRAAIRWLGQQELISVEEIPVSGDGKPILRARIASKGVDFEAGRIYIEGIRRRSQG